MLTRRQFLYGGAAAAAGIGVATDAYLETYRVQLKKVEVPLKRLPEAFDGFTIAQLSDFHYEERFSVFAIRKAVELVNTLRADLVVLTGDFITVGMFESSSHARRHAHEAAAPCAAVLSGLRARLGSVAVLGNHDAYANAGFVTKALETSGIPVLNNRSLPIEQNSARLWLAGIEDALEARPDLGAAIKNIPSGEVIILLAHEPDFADEAALNPVDLQLSGHSHGGQIWIPGLGAPWLPPLARNYPRGLYKVENLVLYTNIGIGTIRAPVRINCVPEVTLITLRARRG
ncbi:MAG TPA: metallophosphoesterase [Terriglobales bacterium]|nr:metallophosphoesterase [Terriglobales bacterium]